MTHPELTVAMPAYRSAPYIRQAIDSVLMQEDVELELIVVDDASPDDLASLVAAYEDPRVRLLSRHARRRGIAHCHNRIIEQSRAPFIAHVDSDDFLIRSDALRMMVDVLHQNSHAGQAHCYFYNVNAEGRLQRDEARRQWNDLRHRRPVGIDYRYRLLVSGAVMNPLRTYRREVFDRVGRFNETLRIGEDYEMALRMLDHYQFVLVPEFLYARRRHAHNTDRDRRFRHLHAWAARWANCWRLTRRGQLRFLRDDPPYAMRAMWDGLVGASGFWQLRERWRAALAPLRSVMPLRPWVLIHAALDRAGTSRAYQRAVARLSSIPPLPDRAPPRAPDQPVAYLLWRYPLYSETFIRRELTTLSTGGVPLLVFSQEAGDLSLGDAPPPHRLPQPSPAQRWQLRGDLFRQQPLRALHLLLFIIGTRYSSHKTLRSDLAEFDHILLLAQLLRQQNAGHIHAPWAYHQAFQALCAARLLDIPFSVQARAHDLHRCTQAYALQQKFRGARFIITNSHFNAEHIRTYLPAAQHHKIHVIYNGVALSRFQPPERAQSGAGVVRLLAVGRLVGFKGFRYLVEACTLLRAAGHPFQCDIVGGEDWEEDANAAVALRLIRHELTPPDVLRFHGVQSLNAVLAMMRAADIFVLPSVLARNNSFDITPNVIIEAMALALPVVSTAIGAIPELVEDGVTGLLVPPSDPAALAAALGDLISQPTLRHQMGLAGRQKAEAQFDAQRNMATLHRLFAALPDGHPAP